MRASKVTRYGIPTSAGGRKCEFKIGAVKVFLSGPDSDETHFVAESLRAYWNRDCEPEERPITSSADDVAALCARLLRGPVTSERFSVGPWTPAVTSPSTPSWAVLDRFGVPILLAHDAFEAALYFARLEDGTIEVVESFVIQLPTDADAAETKRLQNWAEHYRFMCPT